MGVFFNYLLFCFVEEMIYNFLKVDGFYKVLIIMKVLGLEIKKEVNYNLYDMERKYFLYYDTNLDVWVVYRLGRFLFVVYIWIG